MTTIGDSGGALTVPFADIRDCPAHWVADWPVAASSGDEEKVSLRQAKPGEGAGKRGLAQIALKQILYGVYGRLSPFPGHQPGSPVFSACASVRAFIEPTPASAESWYAGE
jgi:hypothetical protein